MSAIVTQSSGTPQLVAPPVNYLPDALARYRVKLTVITFLLFIGVEVLLGFDRPLSILQLSNPWVIGGWMLILLGLGLRSWAAGTLVKVQHLATEGPYRLCRHPLYFGSLLLMCGFGTLTGQWLNVPVIIVAALISFGHAMRTEEAFLASRYGDEFQRYAARTNRFVPGWPHGSLFAPVSLQRWRKNREYNAWIGASLGVLGLLAWNYAAGCL